MTSVIPQTVAVTYLPDDLDFVWLGSRGGDLEAFWTEFFKERWMDILFNYALWMIFLRWVISNLRREIDDELQNY